MTKMNKNEKEQDEGLKPKKNFSLKLSRKELVHLRDLFGVLLSADMKSTISQALASSQDRQLIESKLWNKIISLCNEAEIPLGDEAPDFIVTISSTPQLGVFELISEEEEIAAAIGQQLLAEAAEDE